MSNINQTYISPHWPAFRSLWWIVAFILFLLLLVLWVMGYGPGGKACQVPVEVRTVEKLVAAPDVGAPLITLNDSSVMRLTTGDNFIDPGARGTDSVDGDVTVMTEGTVDTSTPGEYMLTYKVTDAAGNSSTETRKVIVTDAADTTAPVITLNSDSIVYLKTGDTYSEAGAAATDVDDDDITVKTEGMVDTGTAGEYVVTYTATDAAGNSTSATRKVIVVDRDMAAPIISLNDASIVYLKTGDTYSEAGAAAVDATDGDLKITTEGTVDTSTAGEYIVTYSVTDSAGNTASKTRRVIVSASDADGPVINLNNSSVIYLTKGDSYGDAGAKANDDVDGAVKVTTKGTVDTQTVGQYIVTYTATDAAGNTSTATRRVIVSESAVMMPEPVRYVAPAEPVMAVNDPAPYARLYFGLDRDNNPKDSDASLDAVISYLKNNSNATAFVSGYHDPSGNYTYNQGLANRRAETVASMMKAAGISADRVIIAKPVETTGTGKPAKARRVEVTIGF